AQHKVREADGEPVSGVSCRTSVLVIGMEGWPLLPDGQISQKLRRAEKLQRSGHSIQIICESAFLELAGCRERQVFLRRTYPAAQVCRLLRIQPETLRRWEQLSLVRSQDGLYNFQDFVSLRTIGELVQAGVRPETIARSLHGLSSVLPDTDQPLA